MKIKKHGIIIIKLWGYKPCSIQLKQIIFVVLIFCRVNRILERINRWINEIIVFRGRTQQNHVFSSIQINKASTSCRCNDFQKLKLKTWLFQTFFKSLNWYMTVVYKLCQNVFWSVSFTIYIYTCYCSNILSHLFSYFDQVHEHRTHRVVILQFSPK